MHKEIDRFYREGGDQLSSNAIWQPQPRQAALMARFEDEALYGGAAG